MNIPEDIKIAASRLVGTKFPLYADICKAILAERERIFDLLMDASEGNIFYPDGTPDEINIRKLLGLEGTK